MYYPSRKILILLGMLLCAALSAPAAALEHVTFKRDDKTQTISGRLVTDAQDGGLLIQSRDGVLWAITPDEQVAHTSDDTPFKPFDADEIAERTLAVLPEGFRVHETAHYLIFYDTSQAYAQWCGALFERLYGAFTNYWKRKGFDIRTPEFPLSAIVFADRQSYLKFSKPELGDAGGRIVGYYSLLTNRMTMYDLTGVEAAGLNGQRGRSSKQINRILSQPGAQATVATIVHEATHQIAFNCGLHNRLSDCPLWFSEGIAVYFETPDLSSSRGWRGVGSVNQHRLQRFLQYLPTRPVDSLETLIRDDTRFRDPKRSVDAYAEAWALTYFLIRRHTKKYVEYLAMLSEKKPLLNDSPDERLEQFQKIFGDLNDLNTEFLRYMTR